MANSRQVNAGGLTSSSPWKLMDTHSAAMTPVSSLKNKQISSYCCIQVRLIQSILTNHWDQKADYDSPLPVKCDLLTLPEQDKTIQQHDFISAVGALSYVVTGTRPDLAYAVNLLARYSMSPGANHWRFLQHVLGYLNKTQHYCLSLTPDPGKLELKVYSDASWGGELSRSSHGYITTFLGFPIAWYAKCFATIASSSCHAESMALATASRHSQWL
ncbi:hypothetical protein O181_074834 [Austropuccinia psidii MF-1]|uniref:Reverse transcriptase Ty1/copia-type domain-containing protein n=1 Tax=Austropuccinia psidii MF-1 TaxID=1389203 RepID=A0A9Q3IDV3_9BASI|nr:hypothetical protein [Austropuccinia psidii MF-1]